MFPLDEVALWYTILQPLLVSADTLDQKRVSSLMILVETQDSNHKKKYNQLASALRSQVNGYYMKHALNPVMINVHTCEPAAGIYTGVALKFNCMSSIEYLSLILAITGGLLWCE